MQVFVSADVFLYKKIPLFPTEVPVAFAILYKYVSQSFEKYNSKIYCKSRGRITTPLLYTLFHDKK